MRETWYVMDDGSAVDPNDVAPDKHGILRHGDGRSVAVGPHGLRSRSMSETEMREARASAAAQKPSGGSSGRALEAVPTPRGYKTRESKAT